jgi:UDP-2-acetamido-2,6-beta-L-arabino-hexul-4-ose reductase
MLKIGITGNTGFLGKNFSKSFKNQPAIFKLIDFHRSYFTDFELLMQFVLECDVIVHLAALSRHPDNGFVYENNVRVTKQLIEAMSLQNVKPYLIFTSSIHDKNQTEYGESKRLEYALLSNWARLNKANFSCLVLTNVFGPMCKPNYASFVATFCFKLVRNDSPQIEIDQLIKLTYVDNLANYVLEKISQVCYDKIIINEYINVAWDIEIKVSEVLDILIDFKHRYKEYKSKEISLDSFKSNLFTTFDSYIEENL